MYPNKWSHEKIEAKLRDFPLIEDNRSQNEVWNKIKRDEGLKLNIVATCSYSTNGCFS